MTRVFVRADASASLGTGHIIRCLSLCNELENFVEEIIFVYYTLTDFLKEEIKRRKYTLEKVDSDYPSGSLENAEDLIQKVSNIKGTTQDDLLIIDHYEIGEIWENKVNPFFKKIVVIDDLANRSHYCDFLLDTNFHEMNEKRYLTLLPSNTVKLFGPKYSLLREEFRTLRYSEEFRINKNPNEIRIFVCFGGTDPTQETLKVLQVLDDVKGIKNVKKFSVVTVMGASNPMIEQVKEQYGNKENFKILVQPDSIGKEMLKSDLGICSGGSLTWERYCMGLPALSIAVAKNQVQIAEYGELLGIDEYLGESSSVSSTELKERLLKIMNYTSDVWTSRSEKAIKIVDGLGVKRVCDRIRMKG